MSLKIDKRILNIRFPIAEEDIKSGSFVERYYTARRGRNVRSRKGSKVIGIAIKDSKKGEVISLMTRGMLSLSAENKKGWKMKL